MWAGGGSGWCVTNLLVASCMCEAGAGGLVGSGMGQGLGSGQHVVEQRSRCGRACLPREGTCRTGVALLRHSATVLRRGGGD